MSLRDPVPPTGGGVDPETNLVTPAVPPPGAAQEPLLTAGFITALAVAILACLAAFGLDLDDDQQAAVLGLVAVVAPVAVALAARGRVWSPSQVRATVNAEVAKAQRRPMV